MTFDLLLLSGQIALLVLVAAIFAVCITWLICRSGAQTAKKMAADAEAKVALSEERVQAAKASLAATEQQCVAALEQRDEAERHALEHAAEARRATDQIASLHQTMVPRDEHERLVVRLTELEIAHRDSETAFSHQLTENQSDRTQLEADKADAIQRLKQATASLQEKTHEGVQMQSQLAGLRDEVQRMQAAHTAIKVQHDELEAQLKTASELGARLQTERDDALLAKMEADEITERQIADLQAQLTKTTTELERHRQSLEQVTAERIEIEQTLKARIQQLTHELQTRPTAPAPVPAIIAPPAAQPRPAPVAPPVQAPAPAAVEEPETFPMAPARITLRDSLFRDSDITSLPPDQPNLDDARQLLARMESELDEKEQLLTALQRDLEQRQQSLDDLLREEPDAADKHKASRKRLSEAEHRLAAALEERDRSRRHVRAVGRSLAIIDTHSARPDNLMLIKGVKTVLNSQLHAYGIFTYRQIAAWDAEEMQAFSELLSFKQRISRDKWQEQARQLHEARHGERLP
ncbi:MAG: hypothetical protein JNM99_14115 [Verrucomicrobiaceae bacterium]|nr:hypothetical protein [Verrucomicrobiaceae bacterium]